MDDPFCFEILNVRKVSMSFKALKFDIHRVYIKANDSQGLSEVGWVIDETCPYCLSCWRELSIVNGRTHCRACGDRVCRKCRLKDMRVESLEPFGLFPVCVQCYRRTLKVTYIVIIIIHSITPTCLYS